MTHPPDDVRQSVTIDIASMDQNAGGSQLEFRMKRPRFHGGILGLLVPAFGGDDVLLSVAIDVTNPDPVAGPFATQFVLCPKDFRLLPGQFVPDDNIADVGKKVWPAVAIDVDEFPGFHMSRQIDLMLDPGLGGIASRVFHPPDSLAEVVAGDNVDAAIAVNVQW